MAEQLLHGPDIVAVLQQVCGERVPERMAAHALRNACSLRGRRHGPLHH